MRTQLTQEFTRADGRVLVVSGGDLDDDAQTLFLEFRLPDRRRAVRAEWSRADVERVPPARLFQPPGPAAPGPVSGPG